MSRLVELANDVASVEKQISDLSERLASLKAVEKEFSDLNERLVSLKAEMLKELNIAAGIVEPTVEKQVRRPRASSKVSMKTLVQSILAEHPQGLDLSGIVEIVVNKIKAGEYSSNASNMSAVVAQATNALKAEKVLHHDKGSRIYTLNSAA